jgi:membrane protease subunit HflK
MLIYSKSRTVWQRCLAIFSLNDPGWGRGEGLEQSRPPERPRDKKGSDGPPDLDEMWRDFNRRLTALFGRKGGSGGGTPPADANRNNGVWAGVLAVLVVAIYLGSGIFIVQEGQSGVVLQFGKYKYTTLAGIQWRLPRPFQDDEIVNMSQVRSVEIGGNNVIRSANLKDSSMLTQDENIIDVRFAVQYRIKSATDFLFNNADPEATVTQAAQTAVREIVGKSTMDYVLYEGREQTGLALTTAIQRILDSYKTGILVTSVTMQNVQPPEQVQAAFDDAVKAGQDRERAKNEAQAYANDVVPRARGNASRVLAEADGYRARVVAQSTGDAERFKLVLAEYAKAPEVTRERMYLDTMQQIYADTPKVMVDGKGGNNNLLYLPLDKLIAMSKSQAGTNRTSDSSQAGVNTPTPAANSGSAANTTNANNAGSPANLNNDNNSLTALPNSDNGFNSDSGLASNPLRSRDALRSRDRQTDSQ